MFSVLIVLLACGCVLDFGSNVFVSVTWFIGDDVVVLCVIAGSG